MKNSEQMVLALLLAPVWNLTAQTAVNLRYQASNADFSAASVTKPHRAGSQLPASCGVGETYLKTGGATGSVLYLCVLPNTWSAIGSAAGPYVAGMGIQVAGSTISVEDAVIPMYFTGSGAPGVACVAGRDRYLDTASGRIWFCTATDHWSEAPRLDALNTYPAGAKQTFGASADLPGVNVGAVAADPASLVDGDIWYNLTAGKFRFRESGQTKELGATGGGGGGGAYTLAIPQARFDDTAWSDFAAPGMTKTCYPDCASASQVTLATTAAGLHGRMLTVGTGVFSKTFVFRVMAEPSWKAGLYLGWRSSSDGRLTMVSFSRTQSGVGLDVAVDRWLDASTYDMPVVSGGLLPLLAGGEVFGVRFSMSDTLRKIEYTLDGTDWTTIIEEGKSYIHQTDQIFYGANSSSGARLTKVSLYSVQ
jgi:hypothetical protein